MTDSLISKRRPALARVLGLKIEPGKFHAGWASLWLGSVIPGTKSQASVVVAESSELGSREMDEARRVSAWAMREPMEPVGRCDIDVQSTGEARDLGKSSQSGDPGGLARCQVLSSSAFRTSQSAIHLPSGRNVR